MKLLLIIGLFFLGPLLLKAQSDTLPAVEIAALRLTHTDALAPMPVTVLQQGRLQMATQQLSIHEVLGAIPGVFAMNPDNFSQDLRIAIRGFGARSSFGIRGIRVFTDGLPDGTPDGQVDVDNIDLGVLRQMEIIRGPAAGLYGNASGGVIFMLTENPTVNQPITALQVGVGAYGFSQYQLKLGRQMGKWTSFFNGSWQKTNGYRDWSRMEGGIANGKLKYAVNAATHITLLANFGYSPLARDPGALTQEQANANRRQAGTPNLLFETGESVRQGRVGVVLESGIGKRCQVSARLFYTGRRLINRLAIAANGYGDLRRGYAGGGFAYQFQTSRNNLRYRLKTGVDLDFQSDNRRRFAYRKVTHGDAIQYLQDTLTLEQAEKFRSAGLFLTNDIQVGERWLLTAGARLDHISPSVTDLFLSNGDQSGENAFTQVNPALGLRYSFNENLAVYANIGTSFETPTLNELGNNPTGAGGFNSELLPQSAFSAETGMKGWILQKTRIDLAVFHINTQNDIVPYQIDGQPGKTFFRNAGETTRAGVELGFQQQFTPVFAAFYTHTYSKFRYRTYTANGIVFDGKTLPGIPVSYGQLELRYTPPRGLYGIVQVRHVGRVWANDANTISAAAHHLLHLRVGFTGMFKTHQLEPFVGVNNVFGATYMANVQINAQGERYFEPGQLQYLFGGVKIRFLAAKTR